jgi:MFS superfamily sulfate permease-like transporter
MAALAALMIMAGIRAVDVREVQSIWNIGGAARWAILATFVATLLVSIPQAVGVGVLLTSVVYLILLRERRGRARADPARRWTFLRGKAACAPAE